MKKIITLICFSLIVASGCTHEPQTEEPIKPLFTAYNIWKHDSASYMYCINFKSAPEFILVGTPVYDAKIAKKGGFRLIQFRIVATDEKISIRFRQRWHPGKSIEDYFNMMLTTKTFEQCIEGLNSEEIDAMVLQAKQTTDPDDYRELWRDIQIKAAEFLPTSAFIFAPTIVVATQKWVQGFVPYPDKAHRQWEDVWLMPRE